jgi:phage terminase small subunit
VQLGIAPGRVTRRERTFLLEKLVGLSDRQAALAAGYSLSMANNTKQKIWSRPGVPQEFERLRQQAQGSE